MTKNEQKSFILRQTATFVTAFMQVLDENRVPDTWEEPELRRYMAEYYHQQTFGDKHMTLERWLAYEAVVLDNDL